MLLSSRLQRSRRHSSSSSRVTSSRGRTAAAVGSCGLCLGICGPHGAQRGTAGACWHNMAWNGRMQGGRMQGHDHFCFSSLSPNQTQPPCYVAAPRALAPPCAGAGCAAGPCGTRGNRGTAEPGASGEATLPACLPACLPTCLPARPCPPVCLPASLPACLPSSPCVLTRAACLECRVCPPACQPVPACC